MFEDAFSKIYRQLVLDAFSRGKYGELRMMMPGSACRLFGGLGKELEAKLTIKDENFYRRSVFYGALGFAESYLHQEWKTDDLTHAIAWCILNREVFSTIATQKHQRRKIDFLKSLTQWKYHLRVNNKKKNREQLQDPYQLGSNFFKAWLGPSMTYSAASYTVPQQTLEEAQEAKWEQLCQKLRLGSHDYLLDLGCGWGEFAIYAAKKYQCRVQAVTISEEQFRETALRVEQEGDWPLPYLRDEDQSVAAAFGAKTTPDVFVVARDGTLAYRGAPDADYQDPAQGAAWLRGAVDAVLADRRPDPAETEPVGCSVKWKA